MAALARLDLAGGRRAPDAAAVQRVDMGSADEVARGAARPGPAPGGRAPADAAAAHLATGAIPRIVASVGADGDRLAEAGGPRARERAGRPHAGSDRGDPRPRTRAHQAPRLRRQPAASGGRDAVVLPPGGLVAVAAHPGGARELL